MAKPTKKKKNNGFTFSKEDNKELQKAVKNFNAKIDRLKKKNPGDAAALPEKVKVKEVKQLIKNKKDLQREVNSLKRFSERGAEKIVVLPDNKYNLKVTKWQKDDMKRRAKAVNRKRARRLEQIKDLDMTHRGEKTGYKKGEFGMSKAEEVELRPVNAFHYDQSRKDLKRKHKTLQKESTSEYWNIAEALMMENYKQALRENFRLDDVQSIIDEIDRIGFKEFYKIFSAEGANFEDLYYDDEEQYQAYVTKLKSQWLPNKEDS